ncbi:MAG TPA: glycosyltransferase [Pseudomonadales bacterium]|nr:glycosyltransferase [Pseudomonadales bacterium]
MLAISVIICSHNPRENYLRRVLDALRAQTLPAKEWELLLIDNASAEPLAGRFDLSWHPNGRHMREDKIGLTPARLRGIAESKGDLLVFVDDDNVLRADYLQACQKISADYPQLGAWGGSCLPEFEVEPSAEVRPWLAGLLVEKLDKPVWIKIPQGGPALPPGAGMAVRRNVAVHYREQVLRDPLRQALGRTGKRLAAGEDSDMAMCSRAFDLGTGRFPELELTHLIPARRVTLEYLEGIHEGFGYCGVVLAAIHDKETRPPGQAKSTIKSFLLAGGLRGTDPVERRLKLAEERGKRAALRDLAHLKPKQGS